MLTKHDHIVAATFYEELYASMEEQLSGVDEQEGNVIIKTKQSIDIVRSKLTELRNYLLEYTFNDEQEEIDFFKNSKPRFYCRLIYFLKVLQIETRRPTGSFATEEIYFQKQLYRLTYYFNNNLEFYQYCRTGSTHLDDLYFLRKDAVIYPGIDETYFYSDPRFSTTHDHKVAKILANELTRIYINQSLEDIQRKKEGMAKEFKGKIPLQWTGSKTALIELIYALQTSGVFNRGTADVKLVAGCFQKIFGVELGNYYRTFQEIRIRKKARTLFLDLLAERLIRRMDDSDENYS